MSNTARPDLNLPPDGSATEGVIIDIPGKLSPDDFLQLIRRHVRYSLAHDWGNLSAPDALQALSLAVRDLMVDRMLATEKRYQAADTKRLYYLSMEFLVGRSLGNNLTNLGIFDLAASVMQRLGWDLEELREEEVDAALGNGGLGRLAACFLDSLATLDMPGFGYGINYDYGLFKQEIEDGYQKERPDNWRSRYNPWFVEHPDQAVTIPIYGRLAHEPGKDGTVKPQWVDCRYVIGVPSDMPIIGYGGRTCNYLRLYSARASHEFDIIKFNEGNYVKAVEERIAVENISKVLYPSDAVDAGRELRLVQEYFFVACAIRDIVRRYLKKRATFDEFPNKVAIQLNDTHPALAVAELMRVLMDEHRVPAARAWEITQASIGFTNHTLLPEALEKWPEALIHKILPRHLHIIHEINRKFLDTVAHRFPNDPERLRRMSLIEDAHGSKNIRMAHLAIVGSHAVNGVAKLHSELVKTTLVPDFYELWPERFSNKTNGVTPRRWICKANPGLADLISGVIGDGWITDLEQVRGIEPFADDASFRNEFLAIKQANKVRLTRVIKDATGVVVNPESMFDVIAKRIHEYKRQLLMVMRIIYEYLRIVEDRREPAVPRTCIVAGKAAPGYWAAKQIIKLVNDVGRIVNNDPRVRDRLRVVFVPDYRVSLAEKIIPAADLSEQISTAGKEASGTSNMKFAMNGALTICTLDGANIEIAEAIGEENIFIFGLRVDEVRRLRESGAYNPWDYYRNSPAVKRVMDVFNSDRLFGRDAGQFHWIFHSIMNQGDPYFHLADFDSYLEAQRRAGRLYREREQWARKAILSVARMGRFSSDRTVREYAEEIWHIQPVP
jgi:starch phosphorylase